MKSTRQTKLTRFDRIQKALFSPPEHGQKVLTGKDLEMKQRFEGTFTHWLNNPHLGDQQLALFIQNTFDVSRSVAYADLRFVKQLLGNVKTASKEWYRHMVIDMCRTAYNMARAKKDPKSMALAADKIGKYTKLDKDDVELLPWEQLIPPNFEPQADVSILGLKPQDNIEQKRIALRRKYLAKYDPNYFQEAQLADEADTTQEIL